MLGFLVLPISTVIPNSLIIGHFDSDWNAGASSTRTQTGVGIRKEFVKVIKLSLSVSAFSFFTIAAEVNEDKTSLATNIDCPALQKEKRTLSQCS